MPANFTRRQTLTAMASAGMTLPDSVQPRGDDRPLQAPDLAPTQEIDHEQSTPLPHKE